MITTPEQMREAAARLADIAAKTLVKNAPMISRDTGVNQMFADLAATIRAIPIAPQPMTDFATCAADMLRVWDTWFGGSADGDRAAADRLSIASAFAAQAFEHAASSGITADGAPTALLRAFLLAMIDPLHLDLDYLRADPESGEKARADRGAVAPPVSATPQPVAVTVKPLTAADLSEALSCFWNAAIGASHNMQDGIVLASIMAEGIAAVQIRLQEIADTQIPPAAPPIQPADPLSDPRVKALVEALEWMEDYALAFPDLELIMEKAREALNAIGGEA